MRFAAEQAGIGSDLDPSSSDMSRRLALALEPEAAAIAAIPSVSSGAYFLPFMCYIFISCADPKAGPSSCSG